jgi:hypothetical protein
MGMVRGVFWVSGLFYGNLQVGVWEMGEVWGACVGNSPAGGRDFWGNTLFYCIYFTLEVRKVRKVRNSIEK